MMMRRALVALALLLSLYSSQAEEAKPKKVKKETPVASGPVSSAKSILFGPGLNPRIVTPARYFYIQAVDRSGTNFTSSPPGDSVFSVDGRMKRPGTDQWHPIKAEVQNLGDGCFQVFFLFHQQPEKLNLVIRGPDGGLVGGQRVVFDWPEYEDCYCPTKNEDDFAEQYGCKAEEKQLEEDLAKFPVITRDLVARAKEALLDKQSCFVHYVIKNNRVHGKAYGKYQGFKKYIDEILLSLARRVRIPDVEFVFNLGDWPQANLTAGGLPVVSWCGSNDTDDIIVPTYKATLSTVFGKDMENVNEVDGKCHKQGGWGSKINKLFWRGRDSNAVRSYFVDEIAERNKKYVDANISKNHFNYYPTEQDRANDRRLQSGKKVERIKFEEYWRFKYLLNIDGTVAAYRLPALLAGDSLVLRQESKWYEHFYSELEPFVHYVPVKEDLSDVMKQLHWARNHDKRSQKIVRNARWFARSRLGADQIYCYYFRALQRYNQNMDYEPDIPPGYDEEKQNIPECKCSKKKKRDKGKRGKKRGAAAEAGGGGVGGVELEAPGGEEAGEKVEGPGDRGIPAAGGLGIGGDPGVGGQEHGKGEPRTMGVLEGEGTADGGEGSAGEVGRDWAVWGRRGESAEL